MGYGRGGDDEELDESGPIEYYPEYDGKTLEEMAIEMRRVHTDHEEIKAKKSALFKRLEHIKVHRIPKLCEEAQITSFKTSTGVKVRIQDELFASVPPDEKSALYQELRDGGNGSLIVETINASTLKAWVKERIKDGEAVPPQITVTVIPKARFY